VGISYRTDRVLRDITKASYSYCIETILSAEKAKSNSEPSEQHSDGRQGLRDIAGHYLNRAARMRQKS
jgi:hypothetical protein